MSQSRPRTPPGELLRQRRRIRGLKQADLARLAKTSQGQISRIERGAISPTFETLARLLVAMGDELSISAKPATAAPTKTNRRRRQARCAEDLLY